MASLLVIGGTRFVGRHLVATALERGHDVTVFHRGQTGTDLFPQARHVLGDRERDLNRLEGRWDAVIDTCGYHPRIVGASARHLADRCDRYLFVSTVSVYKDFVAAGMDETAPLATTTDPPPDTLGANFEHYGALKVLCEQAVRAAMDGRDLIVRPGLVVGPNDHTDRFGYWVRRVAAGGEILAPAPDRQVQFIDARDLAAFSLDLLEKRCTGVYNGTGPVPAITLGGVLEGMREALGSDARFTWVDGAWLIARGVEPWSHLPMWIPDPHLQDIDPSRAVRAGLRFRPLADTVRDTWEWERSAAVDKKSLPADRETALLAEWRAR